MNNDYSFVYAWYSLLRSRDLSSLGGETDQNIPDNDTVFDVEQMQCEDDNGEEGQSDVGKICLFLKFAMQPLKPNDFRIRG